MPKKCPANDQFFEWLAQPTEAAARAPSRVKAKLYSALLDKAEQAAPLRSLTATRRAGYGLCVWERAVQTLPGQAIDTVNHCKTCHARWVGEHIEAALLPWAHCPYAQMQKK